MSPMQRTVTSHLELWANGEAKIIFSLALAAAMPVDAEELTIVADGKTVQPQMLLHEANGTRLHVITAPHGPITLDYSATVTGIAPIAAVHEIDQITYLRPSRYCESDSLGPTAASEFGGLEGRELLYAISEWVEAKLTYVPGSSLPTDGAVRTLLAREGVCRDFAHLAVALLRALNVPARLVSVYAPGLSPMEYHAVCEAYVDGAWWVVDATRLAPRQSMLRIATGRDAADTAFLTSFGAAVFLNELAVTATTDASVLPYDDGDALIALT